MAKFIIVLIATCLAVDVYAAQVTHPIDRYTLTFPEAWHADSVATINKPSQPLVIRNFARDTLLPGGVIPGPGAAQISVNMLPPGRDEFAERDAIASCPAPTRSTRLSGRAPRLECVD